jgi:hypothetical protein
LKHVEESLRHVLSFIVVELLSLAAQLCFNHDLVHEEENLSFTRYRLFEITAAYSCVGIVVTMLSGE